MREIVLSNSSKVAIVDNEDYGKVYTYTWRLKHGYAVAKIKGKTIGMHRIITDCPVDMVVHHVNHNRLDNRKDNLQNCSSGKNSQLNHGFYTNSSSKWYYDSWHRRALRYRQRIEFAGIMKRNFVYLRVTYVFLIGEYLLEGYPLKVKRK